MLLPPLPRLAASTAAARSPDSGRTPSGSAKPPASPSSAASSPSTLDPARAGQQLFPPPPRLSVASSGAAATARAPLPLVGRSESASAKDVPQRAGSPAGQQAPGWALPPPPRLVPGGPHATEARVGGIHRAPAQPAAARPPDHQVATSSTTLAEADTARAKPAASGTAGRASTTAGWSIRLPPPPRIGARPEPSDAVVPTGSASAEGRDESSTSTLPTRAAPSMEAVARRPSSASTLDEARPSSVPPEADGDDGVDDDQRNGSDGEGDDRSGREQTKRIRNKNKREAKRKRKTSREERDRARRAEAKRKRAERAAKSDQATAAQEVQEAAQQRMVEEAERPLLRVLRATESRPDDLDNPPPHADDGASKDGQPPRKRARRQGGEPSRRGAKTDSRRGQKRKPPAPPPCKFYVNGACKRDDCQFSHDIEQIKKSEICRFFRTGACLKGESCLYSHDLKSVPCKFFYLFANCHSTDDACRYSHTMAREDAFAYLEREEKEKEEERAKQAAQADASAAEAEPMPDATALPFGVSFVQEMTPEGPDAWSEEEEEDGADDDDEDGRIKEGNAEEVQANDEDLAFPAYAP